jgi:enterochelin esterase family protein
MLTSETLIRGDGGAAFFSVGHCLALGYQVNTPMKSFLFISLLLVAPAFAQQIVSPEVSPDGRITFRLKAPNAKEVQLHCEGVKNPSMQKDDQGVWSFTTEPLEPDIYAYSFNADGLHLIDPLNPLLKYNLLNTESQVHVPGPKSLPWEINDVPRGQLHRHFYKSSVANDERDFIVYTPPGYDPSAKKRYPVLYLLHGYSDDTTAWSSVGPANVILDNLIARGQAKPMIVVMPLGYGTMDIVKGGWSRVRDPELWQRNADGFRDTLLNEVMPQAEKAYKILSKPEARAIAGLSMGGSESLTVGLNHPERFAWIGAFSSGGLNTNYSAEFPTLDAKANKQLRLLWIACGKEDFLLDSNKKFVEWLNSKGVPPTWVETPGAHSFRVWRRNLAAFAPLLFQEKK